LIIIYKIIPENIAAIRSSKITPKLFFILLSIRYIGNGLIISKKRNNKKPMRILATVGGKKIIKER
jgi:hypothetical protein